MPKENIGINYLRLRGAHMKKVLVAEDEQNIREFVVINL